MKEKDEFTNILRERDREILKGLQRPLTHEEIEFRVGRVSGGYATLLAYKDARVDQNRLDEVVGPMNWKRHHDGPYCTVSIFDSNKGEWIEKQDIGTESNTEKEKGLASDSFKRACFNWGIGRELYDYPEVRIKLKPTEKTIYTRSWKWYTEIVDDKLTFLAIKDSHGEVRFKWGERK